MSAFLKEKNSAAMEVPTTYQRPNLMLMLSMFCSWSDYQRLSKVFVCFFF